MSQETIPKGECCPKCGVTSSAKDHGLKAVQLRRPMMNEYETEKFFLCGKCRKKNMGHWRYWR